MIRKFLLTAVLVFIGSLLAIAKAEAASCTGADWNCWTFDRGGICKDQGVNKSCALNTGGTACFYDSTGCCAESGKACTYTSGGGPTPPPGGTISCGTQTCNADTEVCCATGCKPISEGCTTPTPTPVPSYTCTVQGYKVVMPGNQNIAPANSQTVTLNDPVTSISTQPYFLNYQSASKTRTVSVSVPANYTVGYTLCYNNTTCHTSAPVMSSSVNLPDNSS